MEFEQLLDRVFYCDSEVFAHDVLWVLISHKTKEKFIFHNATADEYQEFMNKYNPIFVAYNCKSYDKYIWKACLLGYSPEEIKEINDFIIEGNNAWQYPYVGYCNVGPWWDLMDDIVPRKSLKEIEGCLCENITETTVPFNLPSKWNKEQYEEVLYYCTCDVEILIKLFNMRKDYIMAKYTICKMGDIEPEYGMGYTNAKLTAVFLKAEKREYDDADTYEYPSNFELEKIPKEIKEYFDKFIDGKLDIHSEKLSLVIDEMRGNVQEGGIHFALDNYIFERNDFKASDYYEE